MAKAKLQKVTSLKLARSNGSFTASWSLPSAAKKGKSKCTATQVQFGRKFASGVSWMTWAHTAALPTSASFAPWGDGIIEIQARVRLKNNKGWGGWVTAAFALNAPASVSWETPALDADTGKVSCAASWDENKDDRYHWSSVRSYAVRVKTVGGVSESSIVSDSTYTSGTSRTVSYDEGEIGTLAKGDSIAFQFKSERKGLRGTTTNTSSWKHIGWAVDPVIDKSALVVDLSQDRVQVPFDYAKEGGKVVSSRPTDKFRLQYAQTTGSNPDLIAESDWQDVGTTDNGNGVALTCTCTAIKASEEGTHVWLRIKATNEVEALYGASKPVEVDALYVAPVKEPVSSTTIACAGFTAGEDGESEGLLLVWNDTTYNSTRIAFSTFAYALQSNKEPDTFDVSDDWDEGSWTGKIDGVEVTYDHSCTMWLKGLSTDTRYHVWLRRISADDDSKHSAWSSGYTFVTGAAAAGVSLAAPSTIATGTDMSVSWAVGGDASQDSWTLFIDGMAVMGASDSATACTVPSSLLPESGTCAVKVGIVCGLNSYESDACSVAVKPLPTVAIATDKAITSKGHPVTLTAEPGTECAVRLLACGTTLKQPGKTLTQYAGETVWSGTVAIGESGSAAIAYPDSAELIDGAEYELIVTPTLDGLTGNDTSPAWDGSSRHVVQWAHQAVAPSETATTIAVDADALTATITPGQPEGYAEGDAWADTDTFEVWRDTPDGSTLIASGVALGQSVTDRWAPFGSDGLTYTVATVTADGDRDWDEFPYELPGAFVRFDWAGGTVDLPYNLDIDDGWSKDFESRGYLSGDRDGWWGATAKRTMSVGSDLVKSLDSDAQESLRAMARHLGEVFVRAPGGIAFAANVDVGKISMSADSGLVSTSYDIEEVRCVEHVCDGDDVA
jgi:hypothetical protein